MTPNSHARAAGDGQDITVEVCSSPGVTAHGELLRMDAKSVRLRFPRGRSPALCIARAVELRFWTRPDQPPVNAQARVSMRSDDERHREYAFAFLDPTTVGAHLLPGVIHSRRAFVRVRPAPGSPIEVALQGCASPARLIGLLIDISEGGMALQIRPDDEDAFAEAVQGTVEFRLPGTILLRMSVLIRGRRMVGTTVQLRLCFEADESTLFEEQRRAIGKYVLQRQLVRRAAAG
jgi:hypothetical protein